MGDLFEFEKNVCSSSASLPQTSPPTDEISLFLQQIMARSSSSSLSAYTYSVLANTGLQTQLSSNVELCRTSNALSDNILSPAVGDGISAVECSGAYSMANLSTDVPYVSSSSMGASETENDEYDCESEGGLDALVEEVSAKPVVGSSSKRSRAAEFHNLSEKRRRSRINEKMKALQNLIPNSHKTDKASMLDEAIEYLKQLQLQVQMLSMRNGLSLQPMCLPDGVQPIQLPQMRMDFDVGNKSQHLNATRKPTATHGASTSNIFGLPNQCSVSNQPMVSNMSNLINSETSFGLESPIRVHLGPPCLQRDAEEICKEDRLQYQQTNVNHTATNPLEFEAGGTGIMTLDAEASNLKGRDSIEVHMREMNQSEGRALKAIKQSLMFPSHLNRQVYF